MNAGGPGGGNAVIMVTDNGLGFDRELLARVFEPYVTSKPKGTGLGLAIVKKITEEHGGSIEASNRPEGGARTCASYCRNEHSVGAGARTRCRPREGSA